MWPLLHQEAGGLRAEVVGQEGHAALDQGVHVVLLGQVQQHQHAVRVDGAVVRVQEPASKKGVGEGHGQGAREKGMGLTGRTRCLKARHLRTLRPASSSREQGRVMHGSSEKDQMRESESDGEWIHYAQLFMTV